MRPDCATLSGDLIEVLQLSPEKCGRDFAQQVRGADVLPRVFIDLPAEELGTVGAFLLDDLRSCDEVLVVNDESPAFSAMNILGLVKAECGQVTDRPELVIVPHARKRM